jgi:hypothetical protein
MRFKPFVLSSLQDKTPDESHLKSYAVSFINLISFWDAIKSRCVEGVGYWAKSRLLVKG